jgi:hypothetical protein
MLAAVGLWIVLGVRRKEPIVPEAARTQAAQSQLPELGVITPLPEGPGKSVAERTRLPCHSGDILRQQRLSEKQWTAVLTKMAGWGAELSDSDRVLLMPYLVSQFGPENNRFQPAAVRPIQP